MNNIYYLGDIDDLKKYYKQDPKSLLHRLKKADILVGSVESTNFIEKIFKQNGK